jgi:arylsulfatase A-like enzyme
VLSDHGYSFGEHRWGGKKCPYDACIRIPFVVHLPDGRAEPEGGPVSIVDLLPTILDLARIPHPDGLDGTSFAGRLGVSGSSVGEGVAFLEWAGDAEIPAWEAVRTSGLKLIRYADGTEELYDIGGVLGPPDPFEADDRAEDAAYRRIRADLRHLLGRHPGRR